MPARQVWIELVETWTGEPCCLTPDAKKPHLCRLKGSS